MSAVMAAGELAQVSKALPYSYLLSDAEAFTCARFGFKGRFGCVSLFCMGL